MPEIVRALKTFSARAINEARGTPGSTVWHRSYHDRIVRDARALFCIRRYIRNNPAALRRPLLNPTYDLPATAPPPTHAFVPLGPARRRSTPTRSR